MRKNTMIGLGAMALVIIGTFLPLIKYLDMDSPSIWGVPERGTAVGVIVLILAGLMGIFSYLANKKHLASIGTLIMSAILVLISMLWVGQTKEYEGASMGMGLILILVGSGLGLIASIMGFMKK